MHLACDLLTRYGVTCGYLDYTRYLLARPPAFSFRRELAYLTVCSDCHMRYPAHITSNHRDIPRNALLNVCQSNPSNAGREVSLAETLVYLLPSTYLMHRAGLVSVYLIKIRRMLEHDDFLHLAET